MSNPEIIAAIQSLATEVQIIAHMLKYAAVDESDKRIYADVFSKMAHIQKVSRGIYE